MANLKKIKRDILMMGYKNGGLKVHWIKRMIEAGNDSLLNSIYIYNLRVFGSNLLFECNISENGICKFLQNMFPKDV